MAGRQLLVNASPASLRMWSADASARTVAARDFAFGGEGDGGEAEGGDDGADRAWVAKLAALDELELVVEADIPILPASAKADRAVFGLPALVGGADAPEDDGQLRRAFRQAIMIWHPDVMMRRLMGRVAADAYDSVYERVTQNSMRVLEAAERLNVL